MSRKDMETVQLKKNWSRFCSLSASFFKNNFELKTGKKSRITAMIFTAVLLFAVILDHKAITEESFSSKWLLLGLNLIFPFVIGGAIAFAIRIKNEVADQILHGIFFLVLPLITISMTECLNNIFIYDMTHLGFLGNYITVLLLQCLFFAVSGSFKVVIFGVNPLLFGLAVAHCYIMEFRGTPFIPWDFFGITTAAGVANTYQFSFNYKVLTATMIFVLLMVIGVKIKTPKSNIIAKISCRTFAAVFFAAVTVLFYGTSTFADAGIKPDFWNQTRGYRNYGFVFSFFCNTKYMFVSEPENYNPNDVHDFVKKTVGNDDKKEPIASENAPNIICIMNESLSDLSVLGNFTTNEDYMPFLRSLTENTVKGNLFVPVIGAGTSNSEFEFLTGHSTAFLPSGSNAYMLYVNNPIASLTSTLKGQGYSSLALHPYYAAGWNRTNVYKNMGFGAFKSLENLMDVSLMDEYISNGNDANYLQSLMDQYYPGKNMMIRQYISDSYNYKVLINDYENRDKSKPYYAFNVTMQNHGGYTNSCINFNESIYVTSINGSTDIATYPKTNKYLSLVKASDTAFKELIEYFSKVKEPTVICMFGDHQPSVENKFIANLLGVSDLADISVEQNQARHVTPFVIWANYDIEEKQIERLSSNYLSSYVLKTAGVKMPEYNRYLLKLSEQLPVIDTVGYIDNAGTYYQWTDRSEYGGVLSEYERVQYNNIFDSQNKDIKIFYLDGYTGDEKGVK